MDVQKPVLETTLEGILARNIPDFQRLLRVDRFGRLKDLDTGPEPLPGLVAVLGPNEAGKSTLFHLLRGLGTAGNLTTDAHLAALAMEYQATLLTTDADFARFPGLRWENPLAG